MGIKLRQQITQLVSFLIALGVVVWLTFPPFWMVLTE